MVYAFPTDEKLWQRYAEIRADCLRRGEGIIEATEFYGQHRDAMDAGAVIAWPERYNYDELSAIQHAMNLKLQDEAAFFAEYQNEPLPEDVDNEGELTSDQIAAKVNRMRRGEVPIGARHIVFDTNYWKSFVHARLAVPMGDRGCLSLGAERPAARQQAEQPAVAMSSPVLRFYI